jgi:RNA polymerase sigma factor (sigma-70 family)
MIDIVSVGNQKIEYQNHSNVNFEPLSVYLNLAQKTIAKFAKNFSSSLAKEMLKNEDAIANVANCIMMADWRWDKDRKGETGQQKSKYSYRNQCAIWAIKSYMTRKKQKFSKPHPIEITHDSESDNLSILDIIPNSSKCPLDILIQKEDKKTLNMLIDHILNNNILSERQSECLRLYFLEDMTFAQIGKMFNITREAVRQNIKKSIEKIKQLA